VVAVVLSALVLRALIPAGFMPMTGGGGLSLGFCPGAGAMPQGLSGQAANNLHSAHDHVHHGGGGAGSDPGRAHHSPCLFSTGATTTFASAPASPTLIARVVATAVEHFATAVISPAIVRAQFSRGPPILV